MKIKYIIDDDTRHYVEYTIDTSLKLVSYQYIKNNVVQTNRTMNIASVLDVEPEKNPFVQLAKKGLIWDFHIFKFDAYGKEHRKSIGLHLNEDVKPTKVEFYNDKNKTITLKDYNTHRLDVYNSPLMIQDFNFQDMTRVKGHSGMGTSKPEITLNHQLKLGYDADIQLELLGASGLSLLNTPSVFYCHIESFAYNDRSLQPQLELQIGTNILTFDTSKGVFYRNNHILPPSYVKDGMKFRIEVNGTQVFLFIDDQKVQLNNFDVATTFNKIVLKSFGNNSEYTLINHFRIYALENYRLDSIPPAQVVMIEAIAGDGEAFLKWYPNTEDDLAGYNVYVNGHRNNITTILKPDFQVTGLVNGDISTIVVTAIDKSGNESIPSIPIQLRTSSDPNKEVKIKQCYVTNQGITLEWENPSYLGYYGIKIYRINLKTQEKKELISLDKDITVFQDSPRPYSGEYRYLITTFDEHGNETTGVDVYRHIPPLRIQLAFGETLQFPIHISPNVHQVRVSVNPTWTFTRKSSIDEEFDLRYVNSKTGDDIVLPSVRLEQPDGIGGGTILFKNEVFNIQYGQSYTLEVEYLDVNGDLIDKDNIVIETQLPPFNFDETRITGLGIDPGVGIYFNGLHFVDHEVTHYGISIDGGPSSYTEATEFAVDTETGVINVPIDYIDWSIDHVFSVFAYKENSGPYGQAEITYHAPVDNSNNP